jgi:NAD(P)-dependent dehydrogenase (short-subunit alcohol dehydrogenase family)
VSILERFSLEGRVALVVGGSGKGFGGAITEALAESRATVISASRSLERNQALAEELRGKGFEAAGMQVDIRDPASIQSLHEAVLERFGRLDVLVNSARVPVSGSFDTTDVEDWLASARGDMAGLLAMCRAFVNQMMRQGRGSIINIASIYGIVANDPKIYEGTEMVQPPHYTFIKAGMINFTRYLANYYGAYGVRANCISPGGLYAGQPEPFVRNYDRRVPLGRMMRRGDIQGAVVFLASDASEYVTGANLVVDGGWTAL